jgi:prophage regulatory protein
MTNMHQKIRHEPVILRRPQVEQRTGLSRSTLYQYSMDGNFPKPVRLGLRAVGWLESDISDWIAARVKGARQGSTPVGRRPRQSLFVWRDPASR